MNNYKLKLIEAESARDAYCKMTKLLEKGELIESRGLKTREVLSVAVEVNNPYDRIIPIEDFNLPFILQETYDILNSNEPRVIHSEEQLNMTMGNPSDLYFFGSELRQAFSRWSMKKLLNRFIKDKNTRKGVLSLGNRRNTKHTPCMIYSHFIIRDNKLYLTAETRGTAVSMGFINDIFFLTLMQEILLGWIKEYYPEVEMGTFLYKTVSLHTYVEQTSEGAEYTPMWNQKPLKSNYKLMPPVDLNYKMYIKEMGVLYHYVDMYMKATSRDDIDNGDYITYEDCLEPDKKLFTSPFFYDWAVNLYENHILKQK